MCPIFQYKYSDKWDILLMILGTIAGKIQCFMFLQFKMLYFSFSNSSGNWCRIANYDVVISKCSQFFGRHRQRQFYTTLKLVYIDYLEQYEILLYFFLRLVILT